MLLLNGSVCLLNERVFYYRDYLGLVVLSSPAVAQFPSLQFLQEEGADISLEFEQ